ncbi:MAG: hypothetical protein R3279_06500 [Putridiphycobacter sp.]|nr:hypothetical protein [Putridiphycobacter sp.]
MPDMTPDQIFAENVRVAQLQIDNYMYDAAYTDDQLRKLIINDGFSNEVFEEAWSQYVNDALSALCVEEKDVECEGESILDAVDWDSI